MPDGESDMGTVFALFEMVKVPALAPAAVGEKVTLATQVPDEPKGDEATQLSVSEKSLLALMLSILSVPPLTLLRVTRCGRLVVPTLWLAKVSEDGDAVNIGSCTLTGIEIWLVREPSVYCATTNVSPGPTAVTFPKVSTVAMAVFEEVYVT